LCRKKILCTAYITDTLSHVWNWANKSNELLRLDEKEKKDYSYMHFWVKGWVWKNLILTINRYYNFVLLFLLLTSSQLRVFLQDRYRENKLNPGSDKTSESYSFGWQKLQVVHLSNSLGVVMKQVSTFWSNYPVLSETFCLELNLLD